MAAGTLSDAMNGVRPQAYIYNVCYMLHDLLLRVLLDDGPVPPEGDGQAAQGQRRLHSGAPPGQADGGLPRTGHERITYCGAAFLAVIAVVPTFVGAQLGIDPMLAQFLGGTGLLICVSVSLDLVQRIEANLVMRNYGGFLGGSARIKGAYG
jgi:preprotein translocase subunit SecY